MRERPEKAIAVAVAFALILVWSALAFHTLLVGLVGCIAAAGAVKEYILPLRYRLSGAGAAVTCAGIAWIDLPWDQVRCVYRTPAGLKLSPYADPARSRTEGLRGLTLRFRPEISTAVEEFVARCATHARVELDRP